MMDTLIFETTFGSHLFGTNTPSSDKDAKRVFLPSPRDIILPTGNGTKNITTKLNERDKNTSNDVDIESFLLRRYVSLLLEGQTVALDMLFATPLVQDGVIDGLIAIEWLNIWYDRRRFFSRKTAAFLGYCRQQANKYGIKGSRIAAARKVLDVLTEINKTKPGMKLNEIEETFFIYLCLNEEFINIVDQDSIQFLEVNNRKIPLTATVEYGIGVLQRMLDGYGNRALLAEKNEGVDWKALSHAVRIGEQAIEFLTTHNIIFPRANAEELKAIKVGRLPYKEVAERIEKLLDEVEIASANSTLPGEPDYEWAEDLVYRQYTYMVQRHG